MSALSDAVAQGPSGAGLPWAETEMMKVGDTVVGTVIDCDFRQAYNPETKQPAVWAKSGEPIMECVIRVSGTGKFRGDLEDGDNGDRAFHIRWAFENKDAFIATMNEHKILEPAPGGKFAAALVELKQNGGVRKPTKLFRYEYQAPPSDLAQAVAEQPAEPIAPVSLLGPPAAAAQAAASPAPAAAPVAAVPVAVPVGGMFGGTTPVAAAPAAAADPLQLMAAIKGLLALNMTDAQIMAVPGMESVTVEALAGLRNIPA